METEKKFLEFVGTASERAGGFAGKVATIGGKIAGLASGSVSAGKEMLGLPDEKIEGAFERKPDNTKAAAMKADLTTARRKLTKAKKKQSKLEAQLKEMKTKNQSLMSELDKMRSDLGEVRSRECTVRARAAALESELDNAKRQLEKTQSQVPKTARADSQGEYVTTLESDLTATKRELEKMRDEAKKIRSQFESNLKDMQAEKDSLLSKLQTARKETGQIKTRENTLTEQVAALESELAVTKQELVVMRSQDEHAQTQLEKQLRDLQAEHESLVSELKEARKDAEDARIRADSMETKSESSIEAGAAKSDEQINAGIKEQLSKPLVAEDQISMPADVGLPQTEYQQKLTIVPTVEEIKPSIEIVAPQGVEQIVADIENAEETKRQLQPYAELEATEPVEVTLEQVQAAEFANAADKIVFIKALSDLTSVDVATRVDAVRIIAHIRHELSPSFLITHMKHEPSAYVRQECIKALTTFEMKEGGSVIERALADKAASVRLAAVWGLYHLAGPESIPALTRMLSDDDEGVRRRAVTCIGWAGRQAGKAGNHHSKKVISALIQCLNDPDKSIIKATLDALGAVAGKKKGEPVLEDQNSLESLIEQWRSWWKVERLRQR